MKLRRTLSIALLLAMLLSMFSGGFANAASSRTVTAGEELAFDPLAETASIAYERHESGYTVALDRSAESATMRISAVPAESGRSAEGARLYIRTGVTPKAGAAYRVSFTLSAEKAQPEYAVSFDGAAEGAYGMLAGRSIEAGATDRVGYYLTPDAADGELVLRLLLGKTGAQGNTLRFSALAVEEVSAAKAETGANLLSDKLNYNEPGFIRLETNDDARATITSTANSATLTVTNAPAKSEVWKIKLLVATGVKPIAGRVYRFRATLTSSAARDYETAYNEGATEKGYDVVYEQKLLSGAQSIEHMIYVPADKANPGELIVQFAVGKLKTGDKVTVSGIRVEEATPSYSNALPSGFSLDKTGKVRGIEYVQQVSSVGSNVASVNWPDVAVVKYGDAAGTLTRSASSATLAVSGGDAPYKAMLHVYTGVGLTAGNTYRVSFQVSSTAAYDEYNVCYGTGLNGVDNNKKYGALYNRKLAAGSVTDTVEYLFSAAEAGQLMITLEIGKSASSNVTFSNLTIEDMSGVSGYEALVLSTFKFNSSTTVDKSGDKNPGMAWNETNTVLTVTDAGNTYDSRIHLMPVITLTPGAFYRVSFDIYATNAYSGNLEALYGYTQWANMEDYGSRKGQSLPAATPTTIRHMIQPAAGQTALYVALQLGAVEGQVTVSNFRVEKLPSTPGTPAVPTYPKSGATTTSYSTWSNDGYSAVLSNETANGVTVTVGTPGTGTAPWQAGIFINTGFTPAAKQKYKVSFHIASATHTDIPWEVNLNGNSEKVYGEYYAGDYLSDKKILNTGRNIELWTKENVLSSGPMVIKICLGNVEGGEPTETFTISNLKIETDVSLQEVPRTNNSFSVGPTDDYDGTITGDTSSATLVTVGGDAKSGSDDNMWKRKLYINSLKTLEADHSYVVSFHASASTDTPYNICYNKDGDEKGFGVKYGQTATTSSGSSPVSLFLHPAAGGVLNLMFELGRATETFTVSDVEVKEVTFSAAGSSVAVGNLDGSAWAEMPVASYTATLTRNSGNSILDVTDTPAVGDGNTGDWRDFNARLRIRTGVTPTPGQAYRVSFTIKADKPQTKIHVQYSGAADDSYGGEFNIPLAAGTEKTVTHDFVAGGSDEIVLRILLGLIDDPGKANKFTVSNVTVCPLQYATVEKTTDGRITGTVYSNLQPGYGASLSRTKDTASYAVTTTPSSSEMENWKNKLFVDTGVYPRPGEAYLVSMEVSAAQNMDFEVCYNADSIEKGYGAIYDLKAAAGTPKKLEKMLFISEGQSLGKLIVQLSLGKVASPNTITVSSFKVERVSLSYGGSAIPGAVNYRAPGAVTCFVHDSYTAKLTGSDNAATMNITKPPVTGADDWKIKLFIDTGVVPEAGKYYRVVADVNAKAAQEIAICYNNGGAENGYDSLPGVRLAAGETQTVEKLIAIDANKTDTNNLMLQFNLGKAAAANTITVSGVAVEEVPVEYVDAMEKGFSYKKAVSVWTDPKMDYRANAETADGKATLHVTNAPATGTGVWMVKLLVKTGAILSAGKSYLVHADLQAARSQDYEVCFNNEETEKGFGQIYGQKLTAGKTASVDKQITVPNSMTDAGELILQFSVGSSVTNDITVSNVTVQEIDFGAGGEAKAPDTVVALGGSNNAAGTLDVTREKLTYHMTKISAASADNAIRVAGADLRSGERYAVAFTAKADKAVKGTLVLRSADGKSTAISKDFTLSAGAKQYSFTTGASLETGGAYDVFWQFGGAENQKLGDANVELSGISVFVPSEKLVITRSAQKLTLNGKPVTADAYNINGSNYFRVRDLAALLNGTDAQFVVRYNGKTNTISLTTGKEYTIIGNELTIGPDQSTSCVRSPQDVMINGKTVSIKAYNIGGNNFFRLRDLDDPIGFRVDYLERTNTVAIVSPLTPEAQEKAHEYATFFLPEIDGESQPYVGDTMPFYDNGTYYIYYLKESGDSYNHSVYLTTTKDFVNYTEMDDPVLSASRGDVQDSWIGTGSVVKADSDYYFFYTGFNASGSQEYHEKIMVAKGSSPTSFSKVSGWSITPPAELGQKNDFRDPQAYYDPATGTISLTVTAAKNGTASILKYTLGKDLKNVQYDGVIFSDPTGQFFNLECSDTFRIGDKWYLTYSGQEDTLWYAMADSRFGPYTAPVRMDGRLFYAAKHVESGNGSYMVGWTRRAESASSTSDAFGWGGNLTVQQLKQNADGSLSLVPADSIASAYRKQQKLNATEATLTAGSGRSYQAAFTSSESFMLTGEFTYTGSGSFGLAFDFNGKPEQYKLVSVDPAANKLKLSFGGGATPVTETQAKLAANQKHTFTYIQDGSVGIFYVNDQAALTVRLYGSTDKPIYLFAENNSVTFTSLKQFTR